MYDLVRNINRLADVNELTTLAAEKVLALFRHFDKVMGCLNVDAALTREEIIPDEVKQLAEARVAARKAKDFAGSDRLRDELKNFGLCR